MSSGKISRPTLDEIAAEFPEALERFDWSCPSIAASGRAEFLVRRNTFRDRSQLIAQAPATFDEVPSPAVPCAVSGRRRPRWWFHTAGGYACTPGRELRAYWDPTAMVWKRLTWVQPALRVLIPIGTPVYLSGGGDVIAPGVSATTMTTAQGDVICAGVITMTTAQWDEICGTTGGLSCVPYFLDATTAGKLTTTPPPMLAGQVVQQVIVGVSPTTAKIDISSPMVMM